jgi:hypothetical protein
MAAASRGRCRCRCWAARTPSRSQSGTSCADLRCRPAPRLSRSCKEHKVGGQRLRGGGRMLDVFGTMFAVSKYTWRMIRNCNHMYVDMPIACCLLPSAVAPLLPQAPCGRWSRAKCNAYYCCCHVACKLPGLCSKRPGPEHRICSTCREAEWQATHGKCPAATPHPAYLRCSCACRCSCRGGRCCGPPSSCAGPHSPLPPPPCWRGAGPPGPSCGSCRAPAKRHACGSGTKQWASHERSKAGGAGCLHHLGSVCAICNLRATSRGLVQRPSDEAGRARCLHAPGCVRRLQAAEVASWLHGW